MEATSLAPVQTANSRPVPRKTFQPSGFPADQESSHCASTIRRRTARIRIGVRGDRAAAQLVAMSALTHRATAPIGVKRNRIAVASFLALTFSISWLVWGLILVLKLGNSIQTQSVVMAGILAAGFLTPGLCALLVTRLVLHENWRTTTLDRLGQRRFLMWAWALPPLLVIVTTALSALLGLARFDSTMTSVCHSMAAAGKPVPAALWRPILLQTLLGLALGPLINAPFAMGEELGWRGFLLPRLIESGAGQWKALIATGGIWGLWHAPLIFFLGQNYPGHPYLGIPMMVVFSAMFGIVIGWMRLESGSVWPAAFGHAAVNAMGGLPLVLLAPNFDPTLTGRVTSVTGWIPLIAFILWLVRSGRLPVHGPAIDSLNVSERFP
jgi:membrane protease YdiL (CAAX protease family)